MLLGLTAPHNFRESVIALKHGRALPSTVEGTRDGDIKLAEHINHNVASTHTAANATDVHPLMAPGGLDVHPASAASPEEAKQQTLLLQSIDAKLTKLIEVTEAKGV